MSTAYDMVMSLKEIFGDQNCVARQVAMRELMKQIWLKGHQFGIMFYDESSKWTEDLESRDWRENQGGYHALVFARVFYTISFELQFE